METIGEKTTKMLARLLVGVVIASGAGAWAAAAVSADPNPFSTLSCACPETAPQGSPLLTDQIVQGIQQGLADPTVPQ